MTNAMSPLYYTETGLWLFCFVLFCFRENSFLKSPEKKTLNSKVSWVGGGGRSKLGVWD